MQALTITYIKEFFTKGHERSVKAKKNIVSSFILKGGNVLISFLIVPLTLHYLDPTKYGIWLTLISIVGWMSFFNIGLGNGLRNKFAEALANKDKVLAKKYVSTTYAIVFIISIVLFLFFLAISPLLDWGFILNTPKELKTELQKITIIVVGFFCIKFVLHLINTILIADQRPATSNLLDFISNLISLIVIYVLTLFSNGSLVYLSITLGASPIVLFIMSFFFFNKDYREYKPSYKYIDFSKARILVSLGMKFFIIQISCIVIFTTDNVIISHILGPAEVTPYAIAYKYFGLIAYIFAIINSPFWSAYTEAYQKKEIKWIKEINKKLKKAWVLLTFFSLILLLISPFFYKIWIGKEVHISLLLSFLMFLYFIVQNLASIYLHFINGLGKIKLQLIFAIIGGILNIPLSIIFAKYFNLGSIGVILATLVCVIYGPIIGSIQYNKIIAGTATGIWNQ